MLELKFGTETPIEYVEKDLGITIGIKVFGNITFQAEVADDKKGTILTPFLEALSSKIKEYGANNVSYVNLPALRLEINNYLEGVLETLNVPGHVNIMGILPDEASKKAIDAAAPDALAQAQADGTAQAIARAQTQTTAVQPQAVAATAPLASTITYKPAQSSAKRPKFCANCGTPVGATGNFCRNCGNRLGGMI